MSRCGRVPQRNGTEIFSRHGFVFGDPTILRNALRIRPRYGERRVVRCYWQLNPRLPYFHLSTRVTASQERIESSKDVVPFTTKRHHSASATPRGHIFDES